jgi:hypothetical protein
MAHSTEKTPRTTTDENTPIDRSALFIMELDKIQMKLQQKGTPKFQVTLNYGDNKVYSDQIYAETAEGAIQCAQTYAALMKITPLGHLPINHTITLLT